MKVMEFESFEKFEQCENKQDYEMVAIVHNAERNTVCADLITDCKSWKTAVKRFFKAWEKEKGFVYTGGYFWEVEDHDGSFYVCLNVVE